jgi:hypothetical protein
MKAWKIVLLLVAIGIVGGWVGYWVGHALGWTTDAEFPLRIGAGERAIGLSILVSFASVMAGVGWFVARPLWRTRRLLASGTPGHATVQRFWRTGMTMTSGGDVRRREIGFELEVHPDDGSAYAARALGLLSEADEAALAPGAEVTIRYDPAHRTSVAVVGPLATSVG